MAQSIKFAVVAPLDLQDERINNVIGLDFSAGATITGTVDFTDAIVTNLDVTGDTVFESGSNVNFTGVNVTGLDVQGSLLYITEATQDDEVTGTVQTTLLDDGSNTTVEVSGTGIERMALMLTEQLLMMNGTLKMTTVQDTR